MSNPPITARSEANREVQNDCGPRLVQFGLSGKAVVGLTLVAVAFAAAFANPEFGVLASPVLLLPSLFLCRSGLKKYWAQNGRTSPLLVIAMTLSSLALVALLVVAAVGAFFASGGDEWVAAKFSKARTQTTAGEQSSAFRNERAIPTRPTQQSAGPNPQTAGEIYGANAPLSANDIAILTRFGALSAEWNRATAPLIREYLDPSIDGQTWVRNANAYLTSVREIYLKQQVDCAALDDLGAKTTIEPIVHVHKEMLGYYQFLQTAIKTGDSDAEVALMEGLRAAGLRKQQLARPIYQRMRALLGPRVDAHLEDMLGELANSVSPK